MLQLFEIPAWSKVHNPVHARELNQRKMLVTIGDSWTYGDSLGKTKVRDGIDDEYYRTKHIYGRLMMDALECGWINVALPGISNSLMLDWADQLADRSSFIADTTMVITLTESGRHEDLKLIDRSLVTQQKVLENILNLTYQKITMLRLKYPMIKFVIAHNFTDSMPGQTCEKTWLEVLLDKQIQNGTHIVVSEHIKQMNYDARFPDVLDIMSKASERVNLLDTCKYCFKEDSRHPTEEGHALWAKYLLTQL